MPELIEAYWPYLLIAFAIGLVVAWFVFMANRRTSVSTEKRDVLDEGAEKAKRNAALINSPPAAGDLSAAANTQKVAHADARGDAEAGASVAPPVASTSGGDDLTRIKGLGPKLAALLNSLGVSSYAQIADWDGAEIDRIDAQLGRFEGRIRRDNWVEQAKLLAAGDEEAFRGAFGKEGN